MMKARTTANNHGLATLESLPLLVIFVVLASYMIGFFGVVHSSILNSISARTYAFETFGHRADLALFRHQLPVPDEHYLKIGFRQHSSALPSQNNNFKHHAVRLPIAFGRNDSASNDNSTTHTQKVHALPTGRRNDKVGVNPVWIMMSYGICINAKCGD